MTSSSASFICIVFLSSLLVCSQLSLVRAQATPPLVSGLSFNFHTTNCPSLETTIREYLREIFNNDSGVAAGILRVHFHDCFVQGCDASLLLAGSAGGPAGEQVEPPNLTLRPRAFVIINELRNRIHRACGPIVSCADITALAARDSIFLMGGPNYRVPLGRRDGLNFATVNATLANLPFFGSNTPTLTTDFRAKGLDVTDLVALSGGHTIGRANCGSFVGRLYPNRDSTLETNFGNNLTSVCPSNTSSGVTNLDVRTPNAFDNAYYTDLVNRQGLLFSDQDLFTDATTRPIVQSYANNQSLFFERFAFSMIKMGMINVTTGTNGEIRTNCSRPNGATINLETMVDEGRSAAY